MKIIANDITSIEFMAQARNKEPYVIAIYPSEIEDKAMKTGRSKTDLYYEAYVDAHVRFCDYCQKHMMVLEQVTVNTTDNHYGIYVKMGNVTTVNTVEFI